MIDYNELTNDEYQEIVINKLLKTIEFKNFYQTRIVKDFPKPDLILIERRKENKKVKLLNLSLHMQIKENI